MPGNKNIKYMGVTTINESIGKRYSPSGDWGKPYTFF